MMRHHKHSCAKNLTFLPLIFGLSKNERPILDHHAKAHNFEIRRISHEILGHSPHPAFIKLKSFCWNTCCYKVLGGFHMKSGWNPPDFERPIARNGMPYVYEMFLYYVPWAHGSTRSLSPSSYSSRQIAHTSYGSPFLNFLTGIFFKCSFDRRERRFFLTSLIHLAIYNRKCQQFQYFYLQIIPNLKVEMWMNLNVKTMSYIKCVTTLWRSCSFYFVCKCHHLDHALVVENVWNRMKSTYHKYNH